MNPFLQGLSPVYASVIALRNAAYDSGMFSVHHIDVPVISIGNITVGGSGKTPVVELAATMFRDAGYRTAVVSRGYKRDSSGTIVVSNGTGPLVDSTTGGDEPVMLARHCPGVIVIADEDRVRGCRHAVTRLGAGTIILDDAFQHRRCARDLDVVVYDATTRPSSQRLLPAGRLREPLRNLARTDFLIISRCTTEELANTVASELGEYTGAPHAAIRFVPRYLRRIGSSDHQPIAELPALRPFAFCGIGSPSSFETTLTDAGIHPAGFKAFDDHYRYSASDLDVLERSARALDADCLLTTEKDAARLEPHHGAVTLPMYSIGMGIEFLKGEGAFADVLMSAAKKSTPYP